MLKSALLTKVLDLLSYAVSKEFAHYVCKYLGNYFQGCSAITDSCHILQTGLSPVILPELEVELQLVCQAVGRVGVSQSLYGSEVDHVVARPEARTDEHCQ